MMYCPARFLRFLLRHSTSSTAWFLCPGECAAAPRRRFCLPAVGAEAPGACTAHITACRVATSLPTGAASSSCNCAVKSAAACSSNSDDW
ncbi:hypothetical protein PR003_g34229 [Phytophthora rubi]|uniref:Uncharacterized protein n=1 Tax=Phytophthora rubi TaxID=129364 RepID=A0A6A3I159_9STRA|nr:hypothetical protein PR002_g25254 [Phytophthora rubi]KAE9260756.1 hypothetical protein PR003_g34229 [Phytophthora rubi]